MKSMGNFAVAEHMFLDEVAAIAVAEAAAKAAEPITDGRSTSSSHKGWSKKRELVKSLSKTQDNAPETQVPDNKGKKKGKSKQKGKGLTDIGSSVGKGKGKGKEKGKQPQELDPPVPQYEPQEQEQAAQQYIQPTSQYFAVPQHVPDYRQDQLPYPQWSQQVAAFAFPPQEQMWECAPWLAGGYPLAEDANHTMI